VGKAVKLEGGQTITADEDYIRESILDPRAKVVAGYQPVMPTYKGSISEDGIMQIIAYLKTFNPEEGTARRP
jgi:cytochrome c oxidase subunit 2